MCEGIRLAVVHYGENMRERDKIETLYEARWEKGRLN